MEVERPNQVEAQNPIKNAVNAGVWNGNWRTAVDTAHKSLQEHCKALSVAIGAAQNPLTKDNQDVPKNQWLWHPLIDGYTRSVDSPLEVK